MSRQIIFMLSPTPGRLATLSGGPPALEYTIEFDPGVIHRTHELLDRACVDEPHGGSMLALACGLVAFASLLVISGGRPYPPEGYTRVACPLGDVPTTFHGAALFWDAEATPTQMRVLSCGAAFENRLRAVMRAREALLRGPRI